MTLQRRKPMRRTRIKPVSDARRAENKERRELLHAAHGRFPDCGACPILNGAGVRTGCFGRADDGHEIRSRARGGSITDVDGILPVGRRCHDWITTHPRAAAELGLLTSQYR